MPSGACQVVKGPGGLYEGGISESLFSGEKDLERKSYAGFLLDTCRIRSFGRTNARTPSRAGAGTRVGAHERGLAGTSVGMCPFVFHVERASGVSSHRVLSLRHA